MTIRGRLLLAASWLACRLPERPLFRLAELAGDLWYRLGPGPRGPGAAQPAAGLPGARRVRSRAAPASGPPRRTRRRSSAWSAPRSATPPATTSRSPATRASRPAFVDERLVLETPELIAEAVVPGKAVLFVGLHFGSLELAGALPGVPRGRDGRADGDHRRSEACRPTSSGRAARPGSGSSACARRAGRSSRRSATASRSGSSATAT